MRWLVSLILAAQPGLLLAAAIDADCLAIENAFALRDLDTLAALEPGPPRWQAHRDFRLAAAYIAEGSNQQAVAPLKRGLGIVADELAENGDDAELLLTGVMLDGQFLLVNRWRFFHNGLRGLRRLDRARALAPDSVRLALIEGTAKIILPAVLGGNAREAADIFSAARREDARCESGEWAQIDVLTWLGRTWTELGERQQADEAFQAARQRDPTNHWLQREMEGLGYRYEGQ